MPILFYVTQSFKLILEHKLLLAYLLCLCFAIFILPFFHHHTDISPHKTSLNSAHPQILPTKMSYSANLKNVMSMETAQRTSENQSVPDQELEASKAGPSPHDLAAQLKSSLLAEIGLTESDGPPLPSFR